MEAYKSELTKAELDEFENGDSATVSLKQIDDSKWNEKDKNYDLPKGYKMVEK